MKKIPIGRSDFKVLMENDEYYIDKTNHIEEFFKTDGSIVLMPRPRRFGKTLFLTTLKYFFSNQEKKEHLFKSTYIYNRDFFKNHFGKYPVIYLTFKDIRELNYDLMIEKIKGAIRVEIGRLLDSINVEEIENEIEYKVYLENILKDQATLADYENSLKALSVLLTKYYNTPCIVLIDEYDTPIQTAYLENYYDKAINFFRNLFTAVFKDNDLYVKKALITGILKISKESMFSGLNNLRNLTILEDELSTACGFTKDETIRLMQEYKIEKELQEKAIKMYNGYIFGKDTLIFNPWSILNFVVEKKFKAYWANTSSNDFIKFLIGKSKDFRTNLEKLLKNESIEIQINENLSFRDGELYQKDNLFSFLFFSGYLKCKEKYYKKTYIPLLDGFRDDLYCKLMPTNIECSMIFRDVISSYVTDSFNNENIEEILKALVNGEIKLFEKLFSYLLRDSVSYFDTKNENSYHMFLLGVLTNLSYEYEIISNSEAGYGRVDIILLHKTDKEKPAIVMELKAIDEFEEEDKDDALNKAIEQIKKQSYISLVKKRGYNNILAFGLVFDGKRCWVKRI